MGDTPKAKTKTKNLSGGTTREPRFLRHGDEPRREIRYLPAANPYALAGVLLWSVGALAMGAGFYGQLLRKAGAYPYAIHLLVGGAAACAIGFFVSTRATRPVRIGDIGLAIEIDKDTQQRLGWNEIESISRQGDMLSFRGRGGLVVSLSSRSHPFAYARAMIDAKVRVPNKAEAIPAGVKPPPSNAGEIVKLPEAQLAGLHCKASNELIAFETDARLCGRCGEVYHRRSVPQRCLTCDARLK